MLDHTWNRVKVEVQLPGIRNRLDEVIDDPVLLVGHEHPAIGRPAQDRPATHSSEACGDERQREGHDFDRDRRAPTQPVHDLRGVSDDEKLKPAIEAGRAIFNMRQGQLDLACAQCHDDNRGRKLAGITLTQGHPTGYPLYRLEWQTLGSLQRRLRNCLTGMRAEPYAYGAPEYIALEAYLMWRARGMAVESPAVRP